jgi:FixJ family two-component response regulator
MRTAARGYDRQSARAAATTPYFFAGIAQMGRVELRDALEQAAMQARDQPRVGDRLVISLAIHSTDVRHILHRAVECGYCTKVQCLSPEICDGKLNAIFRGADARLALSRHLSNMVKQAMLRREFTYDRIWLRGEHVRRRMGPRSNCSIRQRFVYIATFVALNAMGGRMAATVKTRLGLQNGNAQDVSAFRTIAATGPVRVAIIEDDERVRQALVFQLRTAGFEVVAYSTAEELLAAVDAMEFDCVVADIYLPKMNGLQLQKELNRTVSNTSIVFITGYGDLSLGMHAMRKGAVDFLEKPVDDQALLSSIARGVNLSRTRRAEQCERTELGRLQGSLTSREREVFALITTGLLNKQVGAELGTTERTVKAHRANVMHKMGAGSLADLVRMAGILRTHSS